MRCTIMSYKCLIGRLAFNFYTCLESWVNRGERLTGRSRRSWMLFDFFGLKVIRFVP